MFLSTQENPFWGQIISRLYYSYFHLARIVHIGKTNKFEKEKHDVIWQQISNDVRKYCGNDLKKMRTHYDYSFVSVNEENEITKDNLKKVVEGSIYFEKLIDEAKNQTQKYYRLEGDVNKWISDCDILFNDIKKVHADLINILNKKNLIKKNLISHKNQIIEKMNKVIRFLFVVNHLATAAVLVYGVGNVNI